MEYMHAGVPLHMLCIRFFKGGGRTTSLWALTLCMSDYVFVYKHIIFVCVSVGVCVFVCVCVIRQHNVISKCKHARPMHQNLTVQIVTLE